jgi:hypothetical protein
MKIVLSVVCCLSLWSASRPAFSQVGAGRVGPVSDSRGTPSGLRATSSGSVSDPQSEPPSRVGPILVGALFGEVLSWGASAAVVLTSTQFTDTRVSLGRWVAAAAAGSGAAWLGVLGADAIWGLRGRAWPSLLGALAGGGLFTLALGISSATSPSWGYDTYFFWPAVPTITAIVANELAVLLRPRQQIRSAAGTPAVVFFSPNVGNPGLSLNVGGRFG